ncbi:unnamed protein product [Bursaphelenchus okinawaensis]|uniref:START domain-containing protein n=1 Tax=Bursaphelenchus okinawaensis TaxID=465554 RepID=A0A811L6N7_9BILA|nr:unnamed protein product [Bursaphelenchus okinawaensis]CAG9118762.1 unnamed protein product [Bursaphelenchus okinawaensis]
MWKNIVVFGLATALCAHADFPTKEENIALAEQAFKELTELISSEWTNLDTEEGDLKIYEKESPFPDLKENVLYAKTKLKCKVAKAHALMKPYGEYRAKWDGMFDFNKVVQNLTDKIHIYHEAIHGKLFLSARDAVVVCKEVISDTKVIFACHNTTSADVPESDDYVRTSKRINGFQLEADEKNPDVTQLKVVVGVDLNLSVGFFNSIAAKFKPTSIEKFVENLNGAIDEYDI